MEFEWDETKRQKVLRERGIDFYLIGAALFDGRPTFAKASRRGVEERSLSVGEIDGRLFAVVWTLREGTIRIITARRASDEEERQYRALYQGRIG